MRSNAKVPSARSIDGVGRHLGLLVLALVALLGMSAPAASAAPTAQPGYGFLSSFGSGELTGFFEAPHNPLALDSHGNIFVADELSGYPSNPPPAVAIYAPDATAGGTFLTRVAAEIRPRDLAIDPATDALYVQDFRYLTVVHRYLSDGNSPPAYTLDPTFSVPMGGSGGEHLRGGIAVDPTTHDLLVANPEAEAIKRYDQSGALIDTIATPGVAPQWIAVPSDGSVYVAQGSSTAIVHLSPTGTLLGEIQNVGAIRALAIDPATGVLVASVGSFLKRYSPAGVLESESPSQTANGVGLAIDGASGRLYEATGNTVNTYVPAIVPGAEAPVVSNIAPHSVRVSAKVDPGAGPPEGSAARFEYKPVGASDSEWKPTPDQSVSGLGTVEADLTGLTINFAFLVRVKAFNSLTSHISAATPFSTPETAPETETGSATDVRETSAVLNGTVNPAGLQSTYHFEYGLTGAYGSRVPVGIDAVAGDGRENRIFSRTIAGLTPGTTYHYRLVAQNVIGVSQGVDRAFTTTALGGVPQRAYEQVTPVDKQGNPLELGIGFQAKADGSAFVYSNKGGALGSPFMSFAMSRRVGGDWEGGVELGPPLNVLEVGILGVTTLAVSPDFTHTLVVTNRKLTAEAIEGAANIYVVDIASNTYAWVATSTDPTALGRLTAVQNADKFIAGAPDFSWVVFKTLPLLPEAPAEGEALYRWSAADGLELASILPDGDPGIVVSTGDKTAPVRSVSADGSRIYFNVDSGSEVGVFLREGDQTKAISVSHIPGDPVTPREAQLIGTSEDGRYTFFLSADGDYFQGGFVPVHKLTSDAPNEGGNVYRYDAADDSLEYLGATAIANSNYDASVAVADDGQTAYWRGAGTRVWRDGVLKTVTPSPLGSSGPAMSPDGRYLAYEEGGNLSSGGQIPGDIFFYDADTDQHSCASCLPDGSPGYGSLREYERFVSGRVPQAVTNSGQLFFTAYSRLVAVDVNGKKDVYEYKDGKNTLISPGNAPFEAIFGDISEDGDDVFFTTIQKLVGQDNDETSDVYDARIGGGLAKQNPPPPQECLRDDCKATPNAGPELPFGGSEALSGPGNVSGEARKRCAKNAHTRKVKGKVRCVKQKKSKKSAKRANSNRSQGR